MVAYAETQAVAHVLRFSGHDGEWVTECGRGRNHPYRYRTPMNLRYRPIVYKHPDVRHYEAGSSWSDKAPRLPWCRNCVRHIRQQAIDVGLLPAVVSEHPTRGTT